MLVGELGELPELLFVIGHVSPSAMAPGGALLSACSSQVNVQEVPSATTPQP
jgi:hypothetical protein